MISFLIGNLKNISLKKYGGWNRYTLIMSLLLVALLFSDTFAQFGDIFGFGKNKVQYKSFDWSVIKTEHFNIYFYKEERQSAMDAAEIAERSYAYLSEILDYKFKHKIPLLLYASHNDFQQTNAIQGFISEGTQGVTESLKGRMILPITGSYAQFVHVLTHEMVHAFQFDILVAEGPADLVRRFNPPLWFIEGMAEYLSVGMDNITRMWMRDAVLNNTMLTIPEMSQVFDIRVYRMGEAIWYYVGERYGKEVVGRIFKTARATGDINRAFKAHTGLDVIELSKRWHEDARSRYLPKEVLLKKPGEVAQQITHPAGDFSRINIVPSLSPDGSQLAYVGDKDFVLNLFVKNLEGKNKGKTSKIVESGTSEDFHSLRYFESTINWSRDGSKFSFVSKAGANDAIYIVDAKRKKVIQKLSFPKLTGLGAPSWSPDGNRLVFSGLDGGRSDLYIVNKDGKNLVRLTDDRYASLHPQWSPDGKKIAFTTDLSPNTTIDQMIFGEYNIAIYDLETNKTELLTQTGGNHINPIWSKEGERILFISDMTGIPNVYSINLKSREIYRITNYITGISGIITQSPALSLAPETGRLAFSAFSDGGWNVFILDNYEEEKVELPISKDLEPLEDSNIKYLSYDLPDSSEFRLTNYSSKLTPDLIVGGGAFATNVGFAGQTAFLFSDMLGDKNLLIQAALFGNPLESTIAVAYFNQKHRINWSFSAFQFRNDFGVFTAPDTAGFISQIWRGLSMSASRPFTTFTRFELGTSFFFINRDVILQNFFTGGIREENASNSILLSFDGSLIRDTAFWGLATPISGTRARLTATQFVGDLRFTDIVLDYRKYFAIKIPRYSFAYRLVGAGSFGRDEQLLRIGGPFTFRGVDFGELAGTRAFFQNMELRFPLFPFLPMQYDFLTGVAFYDLGAAWFDNDFDPFTTEGSGPFQFKDIKTAYGFGIRFILGGLLVLRWDFPINSDGPGTFFSIGVDY
ncbi:MAG: basic secretory protein-like protein [bacterium]